MKYYVDNAVLGSGDGSSWSKAWKDFSNISWNVIKPGDIIYVSGGSTSQTYTQTLAVSASGSPASAVLVTKGQDAGHNGAVIIDGRNTLANGITLNGNNYATVDGFSIQNISDSGISVKGATAGVVIQNNSVYSGDPGGGNARGYDVRNSVGANAVTVRNNSFSTPASTQAQTDGIWSSGNDGVVFEYNRIVISNIDTTGHSDGFQSFQDYNVSVHDNWFEQANTAATNNHGAWISDTQTGGTVSFTNNTVVVPRLTGDAAVTNYMETGWSGTGTANISNNTIIGGRRAINIDGSPNVQVRNNILVPADQGWGFVIANASIPSGNIDSNVVWAPKGNVANVGNATLTWSQWQARGYDKSGLNKDPTFTDAAAKDYSVSASSPARGHGATSPSSASTVPTLTPVPTPVATDSLVVRLSEDAFQGDAQFTVSVDGQQLGAAQAVTAQHGAGSQAFSFAPSLTPGTHQVSIAFVNDLWNPGVGDRNLYVEGITLGGTAVPVSNGALYSNGSVTTAVTEPSTAAATVPTSTPVPTPAPTPITTDTLALDLSEDAFQGDAQFIVSVDGKALDAAQSVTAQHGAGASQAFSFTGQFGPGAHDLAVTFTNDKWNPDVGDRNLYVNGATFDGTAVPVGNGTLFSNGSWTKTVTTPTNAVTVPTGA